MYAIFVNTILDVSSSQDIHRLFDIFDEIFKTDGSAKPTCDKAKRLPEAWEVLASIERSI